MLKNIRIIKYLCILLVCSLVLEVNAAVVADNDGSAFITKAEFDSLKNNFQSQIDSYNTAIDSKIDNAIASYLSGLKTEVEVRFDGFVEVLATSDPIFATSSDTFTIKKQFWNHAAGSMTFFGGGGGAPHTIFPWESKAWSSGGPGSSDQEKRYMFWEYLSDDISNIKSNMPGFEFDNEGNINTYYKNDNLMLTINTTWYGDSGGVGMNPSTDLAGFITGGYGTSFKLGTIYENVFTSPGRRMANYYGSNSDQVPLANRTLQKLRENYGEYLIDGSNSYDKTSNYWNAWGSGYWSQQLFNLLGSSFIVTSVNEDEDKNIYVMNECNAMIYAHPECAENLEVFLDPYTTSYDVSSRGKEYQMLINTGSFDSTSMYKAEGANKTGSTTPDTGSSGRPKKFALFFRKFKIKNDTTISALKPNMGPETTKKFNNLNQFKNGKMKYKNTSGATVSPTFYGGIPLFNLSNDNIDSVSFKIKGQATSTMNNVTKLRLYIKEAEFPNAYYGTSIWNNTDIVTGKTYKNSLKVVTSDKNITNTNDYIDIPLDTEVKITIKGITKGMPYFLRYEELDNSNNKYYGGKIALLTDFTYTSSSK